MTTTFTHCGITVQDHQLSKRFYCDALGFVPTFDIDATGDKFPGLGTLLEVEGAEVHAEFFTNGSQTIELVSYSVPAETGESGRLPMNRLGLSHLCFLVDDVNAVVGKIEDCGGRLLEHTRIEHDQPDGIAREYVLCLDPNEVRIELISAAKLPNSDRDERLADVV